MQRGWKVFMLSLCMGVGFNFLHSTPAEAQIGLIINQDAYYAEPAPELIQGRVYVPLRTISEGLGYEVKWHAAERAVCIAKPGLNKKPIGRSQTIDVYINGAAYRIPTTLGRPYIKSPGYTMVPLRAVSEGLGAKVQWYDGLVTVQTDQTAESKVQQGSAENWLPGNQLSESGANDTVSPSASQPAAVASPLPLSVADTLPAVSPVPAATTLSYSDINADTLTIFGPSQLSLAQINRFLAQKETALRAAAARNGKVFVPFPKDIARLYLEIGAKYQIRGDVALAQAIQETGYFQFGNEVKPSQNNFCGLGAIGRVTTKEDLEKQVYSSVDASKAHLEEGVHGWVYATPAIGVEAHIQHLYSYAAQGALPAGMTLLDGRFQHGNRGLAVVWSDLNGRWAVPGKGYGQAIVDGIWKDMMNA